MKKVKIIAENIKSLVPLSPKYAPITAVFDQTSLYSLIKMAIEKATAADKPNFDTKI